MTSPDASDVRGKDTQRRAPRQEKALLPSWLGRSASYHRAQRYAKTTEYVCVSKKKRRECLIFVSEELLSGGMNLFSEGMHAISELLQSIKE